MAEPKTQPTDVDPRVYIATDAPEKHRADALRLIDLFSEATGESPVMWGPAIVGFGRYTYVNSSKKPADWPLAAFSPRSANLTLYVLSGDTDKTRHLVRLGKHKVSGSCLHINRLSDVDETVLKDLILDSYTAMKAKYSS
ncbi:DUF1801 domain-containing protein [Asticcacaulis sp. BYS171W]|uniref:DUF1801 domain-containing protein n=1 Tax=Asticcacaulis aquaticus TaxID=2984212 RepID=A0ABT5HVL8_9CAUL|nr:DUF1801 domain-containing protein [Asticcacaulis aquaticus]MDC7683481.1 DUF1801 domain-containing protein [Asticcacaulis aquaticus]